MLSWLVCNGDGVRETAQDLIKPVVAFDGHGAGSVRQCYAGAPVRHAGPGNIGVRACSVDAEKRCLNGGFAYKRDPRLIGHGEVVPPIVGDFKGRRHRRQLPGEIVVAVGDPRAQGGAA